MIYLKKFYKKLIFIFLVLVVLNLSFSIVSATDIDSDNINVVNTGNDDVDINLAVLDDVVNVEVSENEGVDCGPNNGIFLRYADLNSTNLTLLSDSGINNIFLNFYGFDTDPVTVNKFIKDSNDLGINVHVWMQLFFRDDNWTYPKYNDTDFNQTLINERIDLALYYAKNFNISGVVLDYVRYPGSAYKHDGATDALTETIKQLTSAIKNYNPNLMVAATCMPEILEYDKDGNYHMTYYYGQDVPEWSKYLDVIMPMVYKGEYRHDSAWIKDVTEGFVKASEKAQIWTVLETYVSPKDTTPLDADELRYDSELALEGGADGLVFFRAGLINYFNVKELYDTEIVAFVSDITEGEDAIIDIRVNPSVAKGNVKIYIDGVEADIVEIIDGVAKVSIPNLKAGKHTFTVVYMGNYNPSSYEGSFIVKEANAPVVDTQGIPMQHTANPLLVLLIALSTIGLGSLKRKL